MRLLPLPPPPLANDLKERRPGAIVEMVTDQGKRFKVMRRTSPTIEKEKLQKTNKYSASLGKLPTEMETILLS